MPSSDPDMNEYTVDDIVSSNMEGIDETDQIRRLEKRQSNQEVSNESMYPQIPDDFLDNVERPEDNDNENGDGDGARDDTLATRDDTLASGDLRIPSFQGRGSDLSDLTKRYARLAASHPQRSSSKKFSDFNESASRITDLYYENAAKMIPMRNSLSERENTEDIESGRGGSSKLSTKKKVADLLRVKQRVKANLEVFKEFVEPHKKSLRKSFITIVCYLMLPSFIIACILFYGAGNPPNGYATCSGAKEENIEEIISGRSLQIEGFPATINSSGTQTPPSTTSSHDTFCVNQEKSLEEASVSWWFLFIGVRQMVTLCLAVLAQTVFIDFFVFRTKFFPKLIGTELALAFGQSKGWPCVLLWWAIFDIALLFGKNNHARHWLHYQESINLMNAINPSGDIPGNGTYHRVLYFAIGLAIAATLKRTMMANFVGRRVVLNYRQAVTKLMKKLLMVSEVAYLSKVVSKTESTESATKSKLFRRMASMGREAVDNLEDGENSSEDGEERDRDSSSKSPKVAIGSFTNSESSTFVSKIYETLDEWEEPELKNKTRKVSTKDVLHFRRAVEFISSDYPFSPTFGRTLTRDECSRISQNVFERLVEGQGEVLDFKILCKIAKHRDGTNDQKKLLQLVEIFRPKRSGEMTKLEFVKSIDAVYKQLRLVLANINSSSQIDRAYNQITNSVFLIVSILVAVAVLRFNVGNLILALASVLVSFAFMIGTASSKYVEGILLILVRKPYDIGDKVCFMDANADVDDVGPPGGGWIVENVDLYTTTVRMGTTREYATFTNGSLANSRILNLKRSVKPNIYMYLKFTMNITQEQLDEFRRRITEFIKSRPREWIKLVSLRCTHFETDLQYLKFALIVQHRESWQSYPLIQVSKSDVYIHALHLQKELKMNYTAPELPVHLKGDQAKALINASFGGNGGGNNAATFETLSKLPLQDSLLDTARIEAAPPEAVVKKESPSASTFPIGGAHVTFATEVQDEGTKNKDM